MSANIVDWTDGTLPWTGEFAGEALGSGVCVIFNHMDAAGQGPALHRHPYSETFIVRRGSVEFTVGEEKLVAHAGQIVVVGAGTAHAFIGVGKPPIEMIDIHASSRFITEWL